MDKTIENLGLGSRSFDSTKGIDFSLIPGPFYTPEKKLGLGLSAAGLYRVSAEDKKTQLSTLLLNGYASVNGSFGLILKNKTFLLNDRYRFYVDGKISSAPENYYGIGYDQNKEDANQVSYKSRQFDLTPLFLFQVFENVYIGAGFRASFNKVLKSDPFSSDLTSESKGASFSNNTQSIGGVLKFSFDSRDFTVNASRGLLLDFQYSTYEKWLGSDDNFELISIKFNQYFALPDPSNIIAFKLTLDSSSGDVPWDKIPGIGGVFGLRGYYEGRYRDYSTSTFQVEWRHKLPWRHGVAVWLGMGAMGDGLSNIDHEKRLPNAGVGYRFEIKERVNVRFDYGVGEGESGFYMNIGEAF